ncbi:hypothetical protein D3C78_1056240 [compost metagenome]
MEAIEEVAAARFPGQDFSARSRVQGFLDEATAPGTLGAPADTQRRLTRVRQANEPAAGARRMFLKIVLGQGQTGQRLQWPNLHLRLSPVINLFLEVGHRPGEENREQQPAEDQAGPGVQPGHGLAKALFHPFFIQ